jgi:hypothetical protein
VALDPFATCINVEDESMVEIFPLDAPEDESKKKLTPKCPEPDIKNTSCSRIEVIYVSRQIRSHREGFLM